MYFVMLAQSQNSEIHIANISDVYESVSYFYIEMPSLYIYLWNTVDLLIFGRF